jgi:hypothetical protein
MRLHPDRNCHITIGLMLATIAVTLYSALSLHHGMIACATLCATVLIVLYDRGVAVAEPLALINVFTGASFLPPTHWTTVSLWFIGAVWAIWRSCVFAGWLVDDREEDITTDARALGDDGHWYTITEIPDAARRPHPRSSRRFLSAAYIRRANASRMTAHRRRLSLSRRRHHDRLLISTPIRRIERTISHIGDAR